MQKNDERIIEFSKAKNMRLVAIAGVFVLLGYWMMQRDAVEIAAQRRFNDPLLVHGIGVLSIVFFGLCGLVGVRKLFDRKPALVLTETGLHDNSSGVSAGLVPWSEIERFSLFEVSKQKLLIIHVKNMAKYVEAGGVIRRALNRMNVKLAGSPISISSSTLKIDFDELLELCTAYHQKYGKNTS